MSAGSDTYAPLTAILGREPGDAEIGPFPILGIALGTVLLCAGPVRKGVAWLTKISMIGDDNVPRPP